MLMDLNVVFPKGELSLVCGKLGSGKTLLLLGTRGVETIRLLPLMFDGAQHSSARRIFSLVKCFAPKRHPT